MSFSNQAYSSKARCCMTVAMQQDYSSCPAAFGARHLHTTTHSWLSEDLIFDAIALGPDLAVARLLMLTDSCLALSSHFAGVYMQYTRLMAAAQGLQLMPQRVVLNVLRRFIGT